MARSTDSISSATLPRTAPPRLRGRHSERGQLVEPVPQVGKDLRTTLQQVLPSNVQIGSRQVLDQRFGTLTGGCVETVSTRHAGVRLRGHRDALRRRSRRAGPARTRCNVPSLTHQRRLGIDGDLLGLWSSARPVTQVTR